MERKPTKPAVRHGRHGFITIEPVPQWQTLFKHFVTAVNGATVPEQWVLRDLAHCLQQILDGVPADKALGLQAGRGMKRTQQQQLREQMIAAEVEYLYAQRGRGTLSYAVSVVAERYNLSDARVLNLYKADQRKRRSIARYSK